MKNNRKNKKSTVDTGSGSMAYNRLEMQISQTLHMAIELFDTLDYLLILDYYDDITLFDDDNNPDTVSYYQMKTNDESISINTAISESWLEKLYAQLERPEWIVRELGFITNCPLKIVTTYKDEIGKNRRNKELLTSSRTPFTRFNKDTIEKIKKDIATKRGISVDEVDLSKFVHIRTTFSIPNHKEVVENEMTNFLYGKYPKISIDSVKTIYATILELMTRKQQYELLPENAPYEEVRRHKGVTKKDFSRIIETAMSISIPPFEEIQKIANLSDDKYKASFEYTKIMTDSQRKSDSFSRVFKNLADLHEQQKTLFGETAWQYANRMCDLLYKKNPNIELIYNRTYICVLSICILINEMRKL